ncbi:hypothetical protein ACVWXL_000616 [Bradyrhizobium sp. GM22.5]
MRRSIELVLSGGKFQSVAEPLRGPELNEPGVTADVRLAGEHEKKWAKVVHDLRICIVSPQLIFTAPAPTIAGSMSSPTDSSRKFGSLHEQCAASGWLSRTPSTRTILKG